MKTKKILSAIVLGTFAFSSFGNINFAFGNNNLSEAEAKLCKNFQDRRLIDFKIDNLGNIFTLVEPKRGDYNTILLKNGEKIGKGYHSNFVARADEWVGVKAGGYVYDGKYLDFGEYDYDYDYFTIINGEKSDIYYYDYIKGIGKSDIVSWTNNSVLVSNGFYYYFDEDEADSKKIYIKKGGKFTEDYEEIEKFETIYEHTLKDQYNSYYIFFDYNGKDLYYGIDKKIYKNGVEILELGEDFYLVEISDNGDIFYKKGKNIYKNNDIIFTGVSEDNYIHNSFVYNNDFYFVIDKNLYKNGKLLLKNIFHYNEDENNKYNWGFEIYGGDVYSFIFQKIHYRNDEEVIGNSLYKNGKLLCENVKPNNNNQSGKNLDLKNSSDPNPKSMVLKDDNKVSSENKKIDKETIKKEAIEKEKKNISSFLGKLRSITETDIKPNTEVEDAIYGSEWLKNPYLTEDHKLDLNQEQKHFIAREVGILFTFHTYKTLKNVYDSFGTKDIENLKNESKFIEYFVNEYEKKFDELETKIDSLATGISEDTIRKIKQRVKNVISKYNDNVLKELHKILTDSEKIKQKADLSIETFYVISNYNRSVLRQKIVDEDITWLKDNKKELEYRKKVKEMSEKNFNL